MCPPKKRKVEDDPASEWFRCDVWSKDRQSGSSHDFKCQLVQHYNKCDAVKLVSAKIPPLYNIDSNTAFIFSEGAGNLTATLTSGGYSLTSGPTTLVTLIQTAMNAAGANTYSVTYNQNTYKITIARTAGAATVELRFSTNDATKKLGTMLGFGESDLTGATTYTGSSIADVSISDLYLVIEELGTSNGHDVPSTLHYTFHLPLDQDSFGNANDLYYDTQLIHAIKQFDSPRTISQFSVRLRDKWGDIKDLQGAEWSFTLLIHNVVQESF